MYQSGGGAQELVGILGGRFCFQKELGLGRIGAEEEGKGKGDRAGELT